MEPPPPKSSQGTRIPSWKARLVCWLGIYFLGNVIYASISDYPGYTGNQFAQVLPLVPVLFPWGLAGSVYSMILRTGLDLTLGLFLLLSYGAYGGHLTFTLRTRQRRTYMLLMYGLVLLVSVNIVGCKDVERQSRASQKQAFQEGQEADMQGGDENRMKTNTPAWDQPQNRPY